MEIRPEGSTDEPGKTPPVQTRRLLRCTQRLFLTRFDTRCIIENLMVSLVASPLCHTHLLAINDTMRHVDHRLVIYSWSLFPLGREGRYTESLKLSVKAYVEPGVFFDHYFLSVIVLTHSADNFPIVSEQHQASTEHRRPFGSPEYEFQYVSERNRLSGLKARQENRCDCGNPI